MKISRKLDSDTFIFLLLIIFVAMLILSVFIFKMGVNDANNNEDDIKKTACFSAASIGKCESINETMVTEQECCQMFDKCCS